MTKKYIVTIILGIIIIIVTLFYVLKDHQQPLDSAYNAIPLDAGIIIDIKDYTAFRSNLDSNNPLWETLSHLNFFEDIEQKLKLVDSIKKQNTAINNLLSRNTQILVSCHPNGTEDIIPIFYIKVANQSDYKQFVKILETRQGTDLTERSYDGEIILDVKLPENHDPFSCSYIKGLLVLSKSPILVENVIRQVNATETVIQKKELIKLVKSAGKNYPVNIFIRYGMLQRLGNKIIHPKFNNALHFISTFGGWAELDVNIKNDLIIFNGFTALGKDSISFMSVFNDQKPQRFEIFSKIPSNAYCFTLIGLSDIDLYMSNYKAYLDYTGKLGQYNSKIESIINNYNIHIANDFTNFFDSECGIVNIPGSNDSVANDSYVLMRVKNPDETEKMLNIWVRSFADSTKSNPETYISSITIDNEKSFPVYNLPSAEIPSILMGDMFGNANFGYCLLYDNYLIFSNSVQSLKSYIQYCLLNNTINTDLGFSNLSDNYSSSSNFFFYSKPSNSINFYKKYLKAATFENLSKNTTALNKISAVVYQFSTNPKKLLYNNLILKYADAQSSSTVNDAPKALWESQLDAAILFKPALVKNHSTGENEIFVQDNKMNIYLLNSAGRILWKVNIGEPILGDVSQIDYYRNRKLQYLFNTRSKIYLLDRLGNAIEKYPVALTSPATNGLTVIDYDKNRNYRIFIATEDKKMSLLNKDGLIQKGWNFEKTKGIVTKPLQYFKKGNTDYLAFNDNNHVYILNRKGENRIKPEKDFPISQNNPICFIPGRKNKNCMFAVTDTTGKVQLIETSGKIREKDLGEYPAHHFFEIIDLNADNKINFVFAYNQQIKIFSEEGDEISTIETENNINIRPLFYEVSYRRYKIGIVSSGNEKIYLFDMNGNLHKGFPLIGSTQFSIGLLNNSENRFNLIVGTKKNFLYNYTVQ